MPTTKRSASPGRDLSHATKPICKALTGGAATEKPEREKRRKGGSCIDPHGFDAGKLIKGKKRHVLVDTMGLVLQVLVTAANAQDRDGGVLLLSTLFGQFPFLRKLFADSAYAGPIFHDGATTAMRSLVVEIVKRADGAKGFVVKPKRWIVERKRSSDALV